MCFRPSAVSMNDSSIQTGECPNCGMPVAAPAGVTSGDCRSGTVLEGYGKHYSPVESLSGLNEALEGCLHR